jgi:hypothetical protein
VNKNERVENVLLVEDMKPNLLSVSQLCDQGHKVTFDSQKCEIQKEGSGKLVTTVATTSSNIYVLSEIRNEKEVEKEDEENLIEAEEKVRHVPSKKPSSRVHKNHPSERIIGNKDAGVETIRGIHSPEQTHLTL